jgi:hypothetical protein
VRTCFARDPRKTPLLLLVVEFLHEWGRKWRLRITFEPEAVR